MKAQTTAWRLLDSPPRTALENIAVDSALLKAGSRGEAPHTLHFLQYAPAAALVGYFQSVGQEIREDYCRSRGIDIQRRITGGGALYFDMPHLGWEIVGRKSDYGYRTDELTRRMCEAVVAGLRRLGIQAAFRPRNDIEVEGRKISGTGGVFEDDAFLFQGTLLVDLDVEGMIKALRIPTEKLSSHGISSARERVTSLRDELGYLPDLGDVKEALRAGFEETLGVTFSAGVLNDSERAYAAQFREEYARDDWINMVAEPAREHRILRSALKLDGGLIRVAASVDSRRRYLKYCLITGDFFVNPRRTVLDLEAALKNVRLGDVTQIVGDFFTERRPELLGLAPDDFVDAIEAATGKLELESYGVALADANSVFTVNAGFTEAVEACDMLLLPYCAKLVDCEYRTIDGCEQCGKCSIGDAYAMGEELGLRVITIHNYEHLEDTLRQARESGVRSYVGCCCEAFWVKHQDAFREAGLPAVLLDIAKDTCYELQTEEDAYSGNFEQQTELRLDLLKKVLAKVKKSASTKNVVNPERAVNPTMAVSPKSAIDAERAVNARKSQVV